MVRSTHKINISLSLAAVLLATTALVSPIVNVSAADPTVTFEVDISEVLTVSLTNPDVWASGNVNDLLRNKVTVSAMTNNYYGVTVSMYANDTMLKNVDTFSSTDETSYIDTLTTGTTTTNGNFASNRWAYSVADTDAGDASAIYKPVTTVSSPVTLFENVPGTSGTTYSEDVFFGAKATENKQSGTYAQTVNFVAVTGVIDTDNPVIPVNPSEDNTDSEIASNTPHYNPSTGRTTRTTRSTNTTANTTTTTTQVTNGNTVSSYANAAGVTRKSGSNDGQNIATALAVAAGVAAVSGITFFALAKRNKDDEDDEEA